MTTTLYLIVGKQGSHDGDRTYVHSVWSGEEEALNAKARAEARLAPFRHHTYEDYEGLTIVDPQADESSWWTLPEYEIKEILADRDPEIGNLEEGLAAIRIKNEALRAENMKRLQEHEAAEAAIPPLILKKFSKV